MEKARLIVDSSCDLPREFADKLNIGVTDLIIHFGEREYRDRKDITSQEIIEKYKATKEFPKTSALNIPELKECFEEGLKHAEHLYYLPISSHVSSVNNNAHLAVQRMEAEDKVTVLDSLSLSSGTGLEAIGICMDIQAGLSPKEIEERHNARVKKISRSFTISNREFLYKGGRCSGLTFLLGNKFHIHPIIRLEDGTRGVHKLVRGKDIGKGVASRIEEFLAELNKGNIDVSYPIRIPHVGGEEFVKKIKKELEEHVGSSILFPVDASGIICCHCGEGTVGLTYRLKHDRVK